MTKGELKTFLVTGGSGYMAGWIVKYLLDDGHRVHTTVRNTNVPMKTEHLHTIAQNAPERLKIFEADLLRPGSFDEAMQSCDFVIHNASPFIIQGFKSARKDLIAPALEGTENVLGSVNATSSVQRVVLTSSCAAVLTDSLIARELPGGKVDESVWNTTANERHHPYAYSKTIAERAAWKIAREQSRWSLVTVNPGFAMGPSLSKRKDATSIRYMIDMLEGKFKNGVLDMYMGFVDVRDVARAHIQAALREEASGRHLLVAETLSYLAFASLVRDAVEDNYPLPRKTIPRLLAYLIGPFFGISWSMIRSGWGIAFEYDSTYATQDLGITFRPLSQTTADHVVQLKRDGLLRL